MLGRKSIVVAASVATLMSAAVVTAPLADAKPKVKPPAKVAKARATAASTNAVAITWTNPKSKNFKATVVRVAAGTKAPKSVKAGRGIATVAKKRHAVTITRLAAGTVYTVALFSSDGKKHFSKPVSLRIRTANAPRPAPPAPPRPPTTGNLTGTVTDSDNANKIGGSVVSLKDSDTDEGPSKVTNADGSYSFTNVAPGEYYICASSGSTSGSPAGYVSDCAYSVTVVAGGTYTNNFSLDKAVAFTGVVRDKSGAALADVSVQAYDGDEDEVGEGVRTDSSGSYRIDELSSRVDSVCFYSSPDTGTSDFGYANKCIDVTPTPGSVTTLSPVLDEAGQLAGVVNGKKGSGTIALEKVNAYAISSSPNGDVQRASSAPEGDFTIDGLAAGSYYLCFETGDVDPDVTGTPLGYGSACKTSSGIVPWSGSTDDVPAAATAITVASADTAHATNTTLQLAGGISGTVTTDDKVTSDVVVELFSSGKSYLQRTSVEEDGSYAFTSLNPGNYFVCFYGSETASDDENGHLSECYDNKPWSGDSGDVPTGLSVIPVTAGNPTTGKSASLASAGAINGTVLADDGGAVDVRVSAFDSDGNRVVSDYVSGSDHFFHLYGLTTGNYKVCIYTYDNHASRCYQGKAWDGDSGNIPADATPLQVVAGATPQSITETLVNG